MHRYRPLRRGRYRSREVFLTYLALALASYLS